MRSEVLRMREAGQATNSICYNPNSAPLSPVPVFRALLLFLRGHEERESKKSLQQEDAVGGWGQDLSVCYPGWSQDVHPSSPSSSTLCEATPPPPGFLQVRWLVWWRNPFFMGYTDRSESQVMMDFFCVTGVVWVGLIIPGSYSGAGCMVPWCPMFRPSAIPWAQKHSGAAFCKWRALCFRCQGVRPTSGEGSALWFSCGGSSKNLQAWVP